MKRLLLLLTLLALPAFAGTYSITTSASQDAKLDKARVRANRATCQYYSLPGSCTQTQAREQFCKRANFGGQPVEGGGTTPLVSNCDGATQVDVYTTVQKFLDGEIVRLVRDEYGPKNDAENKAAFDTAKAAATQAQKDQACAALGLPAGCLP